MKLEKKTSQRSPARNRGTMCKLIVTYLQPIISRVLRTSREPQTLPVAVRLDPRFYIGKKAARYTFLGEGSVRSLRDCIDERMVDARPDAKLIPRSYHGAWAAIHRASGKAD